MNDCPIDWDQAPDDATHAGVQEETGRVLFFKDIQVSSYRFYSHAREQWRMGSFSTPRVDYLVPRFVPETDQKPLPEILAQMAEDMAPFIGRGPVSTDIAKQLYNDGWRKTQ